MPTTRPLVPDVGLIGRARTGKDTAAAILGDLYGHRRLSFAEPLRAVMADLNPVVHPGGVMLAGVWHTAPVRWRTALEAIGYEAAKDLLPEVRRLLQAHGVAIREHAGLDTWVEALLRRWTALGWDKPAVVTDVRFPNEADALRSRGFVLVRLTRSAAESAASAHVSETALDGFGADYTFANDGSVEALERFLVTVAEAPRRAA